MTGPDTSSAVADAGEDGGEEPRGEPVQVGLFTRSKKSFSSLKVVLKSIGGVRQIRDITHLHGNLELDVLVVEVDLNSADHIYSLKTCRELNPVLPVIVLASNADPAVAVEVCTLLGMDFLSAPLDTGDELRLKCERGLFSRKGPTLRRPFLAPLVPSGVGMHLERRKVFRTVVPTAWASQARVVELDPPVIIDIDDLSIPFEGNPGGILFRAGRVEAQDIARSVDTWGKGARLDVAVDLANEKPGLKLSCIVVRVPKPKAKDYFHFVVEYSIKTNRDEAALMRFWANCQMQELRQGQGKKSR